MDNYNNKNQKLKTTKTKNNDESKYDDRRQIRSWRMRDLTKEYMCQP